MAKRSFGRILKFASKEINSTEWIKRIAFSYNVVIFPALVGIWTSQYSDIAKVSKFLFYAVMGVMTLVALFLGIAQWIGSAGAAALFFDAEKIMRKSEKRKNLLRLAKNDLEYFSIFQEFSISWPNLISTWISRGCYGNDDVKEICGQIIGPIVSTRQELFGFSVVEHHNFAVYLYDKEASKLSQVWRDKHENHLSKAIQGRDWRPGQGHVGKAFADRSTKITKDAWDPGVRALMESADDLRQSYDNNAYRSYASIPIGPLGSSSEPFGVLVATSNFPERFNKGNALVLRLAAAVLANILCLVQNQGGNAPGEAQHIEKTDVDHEPNPSEQAQEAEDDGTT